MEKYEISLWEDYLNNQVINGEILCTPVTYYWVDTDNHTIIDVIGDDYIILPYLDKDKVKTFNYTEDIIHNGIETPIFDQWRKAALGIQLGGTHKKNSYYPPTRIDEASLFIDHFPKYKYLDHNDNIEINGYIGIENKNNGKFLAQYHHDFTDYGILYSSIDDFKNNRQPLLENSFDNLYAFHYFFNISLLKNEGFEWILCYTEVDETTNNIEGLDYVTVSGFNSQPKNSMHLGVYKLGQTYQEIIKQFFTNVQIYNYGTRERKICIIGSNEMTSMSRAHEPKLVTNINGTHTFSFKMYYSCRDEITGEKYANPFIPLMINERRVKVHWKDEWFDFFIKKIDENTKDKSIVYTCEDVFITELSRNGYNLEFTSDLQNNNGTISELTEKVLDGSGWSFDNENTSIVWQQMEDAVYECVSESSIDSAFLLPSKIDSAPIPSNKNILVFKTYVDRALKEIEAANDTSAILQNFNVQFVYDNNGYTYKENSLIVQQEDCYVKEFNIRPTWEAFSSDYEVISLSFLDQNSQNSESNAFFTININNVSTNYRAVRYVDSQRTAYDKELDRYVNIYNNGDVYGYSNTEFTDPMQVVNLIVNPSNFQNTAGWSGAGIEGTQIYPTINQISISNDVKSYLKLSAGHTNDINNALFQANQAYFKPSTADIQRGDVGGIKAGEKYVFKVKANASGARGNYLNAVDTAGQVISMLSTYPSDYTATDTEKSQYLNTWGAAEANSPYLFRVEGHYPMDELDYYSTHSEKLTIVSIKYSQELSDEVYRTIWARANQNDAALTSYDVHNTNDEVHYIYVTNAMNFAAYFNDNALTYNNPVYVKNYAFQLVALDSSALPETVQTEIPKQVYGDFEVRASYASGSNFAQALALHDPNAYLEFRQGIISNDDYVNPSFAPMDSDFHPLSFRISMCYLTNTGPVPSQVIRGNKVYTYSVGGNNIIVVDKHNNITDVESDTNDTESSGVEDLQFAFLAGLNDNNQSNSIIESPNEAIEILNDFTVNEEDPIKQGDIITNLTYTTQQGDIYSTTVNFKHDNNQYTGINFYTLYFSDYITFYFIDNSGPNQNKFFNPSFRLKRSSKVNDVFVKLGTVGSKIHLDESKTITFHTGEVIYVPIEQLNNDSRKAIQEWSENYKQTILFQLHHNSLGPVYRKTFEYKFNEEAQVYLFQDLISHIDDPNTYGYFSAQPPNIDYGVGKGQYNTYLGEFVGPDLSSEDYIRNQLLNGVEWYNFEEQNYAQGTELVSTEDKNFPTDLYADFSQGVGLIPEVIKNNINILFVPSFTYNSNDGYNTTIVNFSESVPIDDISKLKFRLNKQISDSIYIEDIQFFKYVEDENGDMILPGQYGKQRVQHTIWRFYEPDQGVPAEEMIFLYQGEDPQRDTYIPVISYEKIATIEAQKSNRFNILQDIADKFDRWPRFIIEHEDDGRTKIDGFLKQQKKVVFVEQVGIDLGLCFEYGIDLKNVRRTVISNAITTKTIVLPNDNEFGKDGFCAIARSQYNYPKENFIINFDYYIQQGLLSQELLTRDLYYTNDDYLGYYYWLNKYNSKYDQNAILVSQYQMDLLKWNAQLTVLEAQRNATEQQLTSIKSDMITLANISHDPNDIKEEDWAEAYRYINGHTSNAKIAGLLESYAMVNQKIFSLNNQINELTNSITVLQNNVNNYIEDQKTLINNINNLHIAFFEKYSRYIQEGTWQENSYVDDDKYYLDALEVAHESAFPRLQYEINVMRLSSLEKFKYKSFNVGDICYVIDREYFGYLKDGLTPYRLKIVITEITSFFEQPDKDVIKVQNFLTQFDELFQRITATTQNLKYKEGSFDRAAAIITHDKLLNFDILQQTFDYNEDLVLNASNQQVTWDSTGITITDDANAALKLRLMAGGVFLTNDGGVSWKNAIRGNGISADLLTAGRINTSEIYLYDGNNPLFRWDSQGITAYARDSEADVTFDKKSCGFDKFIRFDQFGLYGYHGSEDFTPLYEDMIWENPKTKFGLTWKGFFLRSTQNNASLEIADTGSEIKFSISKGSGEGNNYAGVEITASGMIVKKGNTNIVTIGELGGGNYGFQAMDSSGNNILTVSSTGIPTMGGWQITNDSIKSSNNKVILSSNGTITAGDSAAFQVNYNGDVTCNNIIIKGGKIQDNTNINLNGIAFGSSYASNTINLGPYAKIEPATGSSTVNGDPIPTYGIKLYPANSSNNYLVITDGGVRMQASNTEIFASTNAAAMSVAGLQVNLNATNNYITLKGDVVIDGRLFIGNDEIRP